MIAYHDAACMVIFHMLVEEEVFFPFATASG